MCDLVVLYATKHHVSLFVVLLMQPRGVSMWENVTMLRGIDLEIRQLCSNVLGFVINSCPFDHFRHLRQTKELMP